VTTAPAPTVARSPISTPGRTIAPAPMKLPFSITTGATTRFEFRIVMTENHAAHSENRSGSYGYKLGERIVKINFGTDPHGVFSGLTFDLDPEPPGQKSSEAAAGSVSLEGPEELAPEKNGETFISVPGCIFVPVFFEQRFFLDHADPDSPTHASSRLLYRTVGKTGLSGPASVEAGSGERFAWPAG